MSGDHNQYQKLESLYKQYLVEKELEINLYLSYEDPRYPTLVIKGVGSVGVVGYSLNIDTGDLQRVCLCDARCPSECACGYLDLEDENDYDN